MNGHHEDRLPSVVLAGLTVIALLLGAAWWRTTDPGAGGVYPVGVVGPRSAGMFHAGVVAGQADVVRGAQGAWAPRPAVIDPSTGGVGVGGSVQRAPAVFPSWSGSSRLGSVRWRESLFLADNRYEFRRQSAAEAGDRHRLLVTCTGPGALVVQVIDGRVGRYQGDASCDGSLHVVRVTVRTGPLVVRLSHPHSGAVELTALLVELG